MPERKIEPNLRAKLRRADPKSELEVLVVLDAMPEKSRKVFRYFKHFPKDYVTYPLDRPNAVHIFARMSVKQIYEVVHESFVCGISPLELAMINVTALPGECAQGETNCSMLNRYLNTRAKLMPAQPDPVHAPLMYSAVVPIEDSDFLAGETYVAIGGLAIQYRIEIPANITWEKQLLSYSPGIWSSYRQK